MAKKTGKPASKSVSALDILLKGSQQTVSTSALSEQFSSVMSLANAGIPRLMEQNPQMHISEARDLHARAQSMSVVIARQFREQRLTASVRHANRPPTGVKGLVDGPTYTDMFNPDWANHCLPDAIEATTSPVAYLADLYRYAKDLEATGIQDEVITLDHRRPDLKDLMLDHTALNRVEPTIVLVNEILEKSIRSHLDGIGLEEKSVDDALLEARYPNALPFERYTSQINYALGRKDRTLGDVIRAADPAYPYFKEPGVHSLLSDTALIQDTGFGPVQQGLLLEAPHFPEAGDDAHPLASGAWRINPRTRVLTKAEDDPGAETTFYLDNFGVSSFIELADTQTFCLRTGLSTDELDALLSVGAYATSRSENVSGEGAVDGSLSGSVYINAGKAPAMSIETQPADAEKGTGACHNITHMIHDRVDRMNRMIRLARWLELPFDEVDQLLVASMQGEQRAAQAVRRVRADTANPWLISQNTLRALGLFQIMRRKYDVKAEDFAALLYGLNVYGRGKTPSQFDRVFNAQALFSIPLSLDDKPFTALPGNEAERQKIDHLCAALGITFETWRYVARVVEQTYAGGTLRWSRELVSAFYRLVRLPRYVGLSTIEALALLELLDDGGSRLVAKLAGTTQIASYYASDNTDTLSVIYALVDCSAWLKEHRWSVAQLCRLVLPSATQPVATDAEQELLQQINGRLRAALITDSSFAQAGAPDVSVMAATDERGAQAYVSDPIDWFEELSSFIETGRTESTDNARGLVKYLSRESEEVFENALSSAVEDALKRNDLPVEELHPKITNMIMRARGAQEALLMEGLAGYLNTSADLAKALLFWADGNRYQLLKEVMRVYGTSTAGQVAIGDDVLLALEALSKRAVLANHLGLSSAFIVQLIGAPAWFGLEDAALSIQLVYSSTQYVALLQQSEKNEDTLLDYLRLINTLWGQATPGDKRLIRDSASNVLAGFLRWGVREVLTVAHELNHDAIIFSLKDLDVVSKVCLFSRQTTLDAKALLALSHLTPISPTDVYRYAAEMTLSCLTESLQGEPAGEVGQSVSTTLVVTPDYLVANRERDEAVYTITLRDFMNEPISDIRIYWSTDFGELDNHQTITDEKGMTSTTLKTGTKVGAASVIARYGFGSCAKAPQVVIGCDTETLHFTDPYYDRASAAANYDEVVEYRVRLVDNFGNAGVDREVEWGTTIGEFVRYHTYTDLNGTAQAILRSRQIGEASVVAGFQNGQSYTYPPVKFTSVPYFQYVRFDNAIVEGMEVGISARLVEINDDPVSGATVEWRATVPGLEITSASTNSDGVARSRFKSEQAGEVVVTVAYEGETQDKSSALTPIHPEVTIREPEASADYYMVETPDPIVFSARVCAGEVPAVRIPVDWSIDGEPMGSSLSDTNGKVSYDGRFALGDHVVSAKVQGGNAWVSFEVKAVPFFKFDVRFDGNGFPFDGVLRSGVNAKILVAVVDKDGLPVLGVKYRLASSGADPLLIGVVVGQLNETVTSRESPQEYNVRGENDLVVGDFVLKLEMPHAESSWFGEFKKAKNMMPYLNRSPYSQSEAILRYDKRVYSEWFRRIKTTLVVVRVPERNEQYDARVAGIPFNGSWTDTVVEGSFAWSGMPPNTVEFEVDDYLVAGGYVILAGGRFRYPS
ncbi:Tc toxin subunit A [Pseudomonas sp. SLFW]|uniref:Tc toxin subunit A n=1 Tax=Pseudomonas sp. SLFW TaxID=2683259 RepID=UPI0014136DE6|nr:Tc toxin subunit A [Pseudomonas sp. SLFW]NBB08027.1 hypothetical protein [Pseudomonas sp. SLFW]